MSYIKPFSIDCKRFKVPFLLKYKCPHCKKDAEKDFNQEYLMCPTANKDIPVQLYCYECNEESTVSIRLNVGITVDETTIKKI